MAELEQIRGFIHPSFRYLVDVDGVSVAAFTECTLPTIEWEVEEVKEGGNNTYVQQLPGRRKAGKISLKNGVGSSALMDWYIKVMMETYERKSVAITLMDSSHKYLMTLDIQDALPIKWTGPQLKTDTSAIAIQTLDFVCGEITVIFV